MSKTLKFCVLVCLLAGANAWGAFFADDFNRSNGPVGNDWTTQLDGTITVQIVDNEVLIAGTEGATAWNRAGITRTVSGETRVSCDFKANDVFNFHVRIWAAGSPAWLEVYAWAGGPFSYANSTTGAWPAGPWTAIPGSDMVAGEYNHVVLEKKGTDLVFTLNGKEVIKIANSAFTTIRQVQIASDADANQKGSLHIDNVQIGTLIPGVAKAPNPAANATDVPRDITLGWTAGQYAKTHNVYLGTSFADANTADVAKAVSKGQTGTSFQPVPPLEYGRTYYWRVDEVNAAPSNTVFKGEVWSFTVEPYAYPIPAASITATASSQDKSTTGPINTINGSGLTNDLHATNSNAMWLSSTTGATPVWIQYQFDKVYKLQEMWVWNHNTDFEPVLGYGFKDVAIETSTDGTTWTAPKDVQFGKSTALAGYGHNTTVDLSGCLARYVKLTAKSNWSMVGLKQSGLSEVRFYQVPAQAWSPDPSTVTGGIIIDGRLKWRPGREATSHKVYFGTDPSAVAKGTAPAKTVSDASYDPGALNFGTTYYWKVDEIGTVTYPGPVWSFTTQEYTAVDDFESYTDKQGQEIFSTWIDGVTDGTSGSTVGYMNATNGTFGETSIVHNAKQSMPFEYNNVKAPYFSEAQRTFDTAQDWTAHGADTLRLYFWGFPQSFVDKGNNAYSVSSTGADIWNNADQFRFVYKQLNGNGSITARVDSLTRSDAWSKAGVMIRESLDPGSKHASMMVTPDNSCALQYRNITAGSSNSTNWPTGAAAVKAPYWVRITRTGNMFKGESSPDGKTWTALGADQNITMTANVFIGLAVTSHNPGAYSTAEFSNVLMTGVGNWQDLSIGVWQQSNAPAPLYLTVEDKLGKAKTIIYPDPIDITKPIWTEWKIPLSDLGPVDPSRIRKFKLGLRSCASFDPKDPTKPTDPWLLLHCVGRIFLDDLEIGHGPISPKPSVPENGSFETGSMAPWTAWSGGGASITTGVVTGAETFADPVGGAYCLSVKVSGPSADFQDCGFGANSLTLKAGNRYTLSASLRVRSGTGKVDMRLQRAAAPWESHGQWQFTITDQWAVYKVTSEVLAADVTPAAANFYVGFQGQELLVDSVRVYVDN